MVDGLGADGQPIPDLQADTAPALPDEVPQVGALVREPWTGPAMTYAAPALDGVEGPPRPQSLGETDAPATASVAASAASLTLSSRSGTRSLGRRHTPNSERLLAELAAMDAQVEAETAAAQSESIDSGSIVITVPTAAQLDEMALEEGALGEAPDKVQPKPAEGHD